VFIVSFTVKLGHCDQLLRVTYVLKNLLSLPDTSSSIIDDDEQVDNFVQLKGKLRL
jgi:hypothetical protein